MRYVIHPSGLIECEYSKCGEWHSGGHELDELLPDDTLKEVSGNDCCIVCSVAYVDSMRYTHTSCNGRLAARIARNYGMVDGAHHKQWVIDQMLRSVLDKQGYDRWVKEMDADPAYDNWNVGIKP